MRTSGAERGRRPWITPSSPAELEEFWITEYPEIDRASGKIRILEENGYTLAGYFIVHPDSWLENYYNPMEARFTTFLERNHHAAGATKIVEEHREEINFCQTYRDHYSYGFCAAGKNG